MNLDPTKAAEQPVADQQVVEHLRPPVMDHAEASGALQPPVEHDHSACCKFRIPGVLRRPCDQAKRRLVILGIEIARNENERIGLSGKELVEKETQFECLT